MKHILIILGLFAGLAVSGQEPAETSNKVNVIGGSGGSSSLSSTTSIGTLPTDTTPTFVLSGEAGTLKKIPLTNVDDLPLISPDSVRSGVIIGGSAANSILKLNSNSATSGNTAGSTAITFNTGNSSAIESFKIRQDGKVNFIRSSLANAVDSNTIALWNPTQATAGATVQYSPAIVFIGQGWNTAAGGSNRKVYGKIQLMAASATSATGQLVLSTSSDGASWNNIIITGSGALYGIVSATDLSCTSFSTGIPWTLAGTATLSQARANSATIRDMTLTPQAAQSGQSNRNGGNLLLRSGVPTGSGYSAVKIGRSDRGGTGTSDNVNTYDALVITSEQTLTNTNAIGLFEVSLPTLAMAGGTIEYSITSTDGTDMQSHSGMVSYSAVNKGGVYTTDIDDFATSSTAVSAGGLTDAWTVVEGSNKITITVAATSTTITPTSMKIYYVIHNGSRQTITQL